jgi:hypothetical protein
LDAETHVAGVEVAARGIEGFQNNYDKLKKTPDEQKKDTLAIFDAKTERLTVLETAQ